MKLTIVLRDDAKRDLYLAVSDLRVVDGEGQKNVPHGGNFSRGQRREVFVVGQSSKEVELDLSSCGGC